VIRLLWNAFKVHERFGFGLSPFFCEESGEIRICKRSMRKYLQGLVNAKDLIQVLVNLQKQPVLRRELIVIVTFGVFLHPLQICLTFEEERLCPREIVENAFKGGFFSLNNAFLSSHTISLVENEVHDLAACFVHFRYLARRFL
jgi:hypothetical protein